MRRLGLISDTHGVLDERVAAAFKRVDRIIHAGDIGSEKVIWELESIAPVTAVLGNMDRSSNPELDYPSIARFVIDDVRFVLVHDRHALGPVTSEEADVVVFGHTHMPLVQEVDGVRWVNPGSASQYRRSPVGRSVAMLDVEDSSIADIEIVPLDRFGEQAPSR